MACIQASLDQSKHFSTQKASSNSGLFPSSSIADSGVADSLPQAGTDSPYTNGSTSNISAETASEKSINAPEQQKSSRDVHGIAWVLVVLSILSSTFIFALDNTIVADVQPAIVERFGSIPKLPWLSVAFLVAAASTNLVWSVILKESSLRTSTD